MMPGERFAVEPSGGEGRGRTGGPPGSAPERPFIAGEIADRGPLERGAPPPPDRHAREQRELERQAAWRDQAARALTALRADEGTAPMNALELPEAGLADLDRLDRLDHRFADSRLADPRLVDSRLADPRPPVTALALVGAELEADDEDDDPAEDRADTLTAGTLTAGTPTAGDGQLLRVTEGLLPTLRVLPFGVSRKRLEQAIRELQLPVIVARNIDEADVVMTLRSEYRSKPPTVLDAEERGMPVYVLKSNTILQMHASLTSIFSLALDPREAAMRETEEAIGMVIERSEAVELSPQSAYIRRLQHQMAERANLVSRSRGREPYRRVRLYPDQARVWP
jgi:hypothetical protein